MKMEYEYVCQRSKDIAYGELLCIMQLFVSTFIQTHARTPDSTEINTITRTEDYKSMSLSTLFLNTKSRKCI